MLKTSQFLEWFPGGVLRSEGQDDVNYTGDFSGGSSIVVVNKVTQHGKQYVFIVFITKM